MILNLLTAANSSVNGDFQASVAPSSFRARVSNGNYTTPFFEAMEQNGVGPFEYAWSVTGEAGALVNINNEIAKRVNLNVSSYNSDVELQLTCEITDTGNSNNKTTATSDILILFGENL